MKMRRRLRRYFITGLVVITPLGATWFVLSWLFVRLDAILGEPLGALLPFRVPGLGLLLLILVILVVGWLAYQTAGHQLIRSWDRLLVRFPLAGRIYAAASQIIQTLMGRDERVIRRVVLVPFPAEGGWAIGFVTAEESTLSAALGAPHASVFVPLAPPTAGLLLTVPRDRLRDAPLSVEAAMKLILSGGAVDLGGEAPGPPSGALDMDRLLARRDD
jgi:uncharacterized membrane protein